MDSPWLKYDGWHSWWPEETYSSSPRPIVSVCCQDFHGHLYWYTTFVSLQNIVYDTSISCDGWLGFLDGRRHDGYVDPNRDFPYGRSDPNCFRSPTARMFQALTSQTLTQLVLTFHGGMVALAYEWGAVNHLPPNDKSPDDISKAQIGNWSICLGPLSHVRSIDVCRSSVKRLCV